MLSPGPEASADRSGEKPRFSLALSFGHFSSVIRVRSWEYVEPFFNPGGMFREVHVVAIGDAFDYPARRFGSVVVHPLAPAFELKGLRRLSDLIGFFVGTRKLIQVIREYDIDLVAQIDSSPLKFGIPAVLAARFAGIPSIVTLCSDYAAVTGRQGIWRRRVEQILWPLVLRGATRIRAKSHSISSFPLRYGVSASKVRVIPNKLAIDDWVSRPTDLEIRRAAEELGVADLVKDSIVFITCGRLIESKNVERMLEAMAVAVQECGDLVLLIVGEGPLRSSLEALSVKLGIQETVRFLGHLDHGRLGLAYHMSDVFLFTSLFEGHPRALVEAMLAHLPVIASRHGAIAELVPDGHGGRLIDALDVGQIATAIIELARDPNLRHQLAVGRYWDPSDFSLDEVGQQEAALYLEAIGDYKGAAEVHGPRRGETKGSARVD